MLATYRTPLALLLASSLITGAALLADDSSNTALSTSPSGSWLPNDEADSVTRVGPAGAEATISVLDPVGRLDVLSIDGQVYVTDEAGHVSRLDLALLDIADETDLGDDVELVGGGARLYAVDPAAATSQELDPRELTPRGRPVNIAGTIGDAVVDDDGLLWVVDLDTGAVLVIDGERIIERLPIGAPGSDIDLTVSSIGTVILDRDAPAVILPDGGSIPFELDGHGRVATPDHTNGAPVVPVLRGGVLVLIDLASERVTTVRLDDAGDDLGTPQTTSTRAIVPDHSRGSIHLIDLITGEIGAEIELTGSPTSFDVVVDGDVAYVNDRDSERVWMIEPDGSLVERRKYDPDSEGGRPRPGSTNDEERSEDDDRDGSDDEPDEEDPGEEDDDEPSASDRPAVAG